MEVTFVPTVFTIYAENARQQISTKDTSPWYNLQQKLSLTLLIILVKSIMRYPALYSDSFSQVGVLEACI
jgi:hypothetical protein